MKKKTKTRKTVKSKRKATPAQLRALKKARLARKKTSAPKRKKTATRKVISRKKRTSVNTKQKKASSKRRKYGGRYMAKKSGAIAKGTKRFLQKSNAAEMMTNAGVAVVSGITSGYLVSKLPITSSKARSTVPIITGILMSGLFGKNKLIASAAQGMVVLGTVSLFKQFAPSVPMLAGERTIRLPYNPTTRRKLMGRPVKFRVSDKRMGRVVRLGAANQRISHEKRRYRVS